MAEPVPPPSPPYSGDSNSLPGDPPNPEKKRKASTSAAEKASKRRHVINLSSSSSEETTDTASNEPIPERDGKDKVVEMPDVVVYQEIADYEFLFGSNPATDREHMRNFSLPYIQMGIGNKSGWDNKFRRLRFKFKIEKAHLVLPYQEEEYLLWKKMFKRDPPPDSGSMT